MNANLRNFALWVIIVLLLLALFTLFQNPSQRAASQDISFSQLLNEVEQGRVRDVLIQGPEIHGTFSNGQSFQTYAPNDPSLVAPSDMPDAIRGLAKAAGEPVPETTGAMVRAALESVAAAIRRTLAELDGLVGRRIGRVHVVGGGVKNALLCQMIADATNRPVVAGPVEATAIGNILEHNPEDMTVTCEAGVSLSRLQRALARHQQRVSLDLPREDRSTIGGVCATNAAGGLRHAYGLPRDLLLGVTAVDGCGRTLQAGGRVVKNVAGYDLTRLLAGSRGSLCALAFGRGVV